MTIPIATTPARAATPAKTHKANVKTSIALCVPPVLSAATLHAQPARLREDRPSRRDHTRNVRRTMARPDLERHAEVADLVEVHTVERGRENDDPSPGIGITQVTGPPHDPHDPHAHPRTLRRRRRATRSATRRGRRELGRRVRQEVEMATNPAVQLRSEDLPDRHLIRCRRIGPASRDQPGPVHDAAHRAVNRSRG